MCGPSNDGAAAAEAAERRRQQQIAATTGRINEVFADPAREAAYDTHRQHVLDFNMDEHNQRSEDAARELKFSLARAGLSGGSAHADARGRLDRNITDEAVRVGEFADSSAHGLRRADENAKQTLIAQAQTGLDATTATQRALSDMQLNLDQAGSDRTYQSFGDLMAGVALLNQQGQQRAGVNRARVPTSGSPTTTKRYYGNTTTIG